MLLLIFHPNHQKQEIVKKREEDPIINNEPIIDVIEDRIDIVHSDEIISSQEQIQGKQGHLNFDDPEFCLETIFWFIQKHLVKPETIRLGVVQK